jgi:hypothetical protein
MIIITSFVGLWPSTLSYLNFNFIKFLRHLVNFSPKSAFVSISDPWIFASVAPNKQLIGDFVQLLVFNPYIFTFYLGWGLQKG